MTEIQALWAIVAAEGVCLLGCAFTIAYVAKQAHHTLWNHHKALKRILAMLNDGDDA